MFSLLFSIFFRVDTGIIKSIVRSFVSDSVTFELHLLVLDGVSTEPNRFLPSVKGDLNGVRLLVALSRFVSRD